MNRHMPPDGNGAHPSDDPMDQFDLDRFVTLDDNLHRDQRNRDCGIRLVIEFVLMGLKP